MRTRPIVQPCPIQSDQAAINFELSTYLPTFTSMNILAILSLLMFAGSVVRKAFGLKRTSFKPNGYASCALFTEGAVVSQISGTVNATTFARNKGGSVIRNRRTPINRRSVGQSTQRQSLGNLASGWRALSQVVRDGWNSAAGSFPYQNVLGLTKYLSGMQLYVKFSQNALLINQSAPTAAPAAGSFPTITGTLTATDAPTISLAFTPATIPGAMAFALYATAPLSAGVGAPGQSQFRFISFVNAAATSPKNMLVAYQGVHGNPIKGAKIFVEIKPILFTGQAGTPVRVSTIVT